MSEENKTIIFSISNGFGHRAQAPYVQVLIESADFMTQMSPAEARSLAMNLVECAESAEQDAFFISFLRKKVGADDKAVAGVLVQFREWREKKDGS